MKNFASIYWSLALTQLVQCLPSPQTNAGDDQINVIELEASPPLRSSQPIGPSFISFSFELSSFPDYVGNSSNPNAFTANLISNIASIQGSQPIIRVGGDSQDAALLTGYISEPFNPKPHTPDVLEMGHSFFDSYKALPKSTRYIHGLNFAMNSANHQRSLVGAAILACEALRGGRLHAWELGNEADLYSIPIPPRGVRRAGTWDGSEYAFEWVNATRTLREGINTACPDMVSDPAFRFIGPSYSGNAWSQLSSNIDPLAALSAGMNTDHILRELSTHLTLLPLTTSSSSSNPMPPLTALKHLLSIRTTAAALTQAASLVSLQRTTTLAVALTSVQLAPYPGLRDATDTLAAALAALDLYLRAAAAGIRRVHPHQTTHSFAAAWQASRAAAGGGQRTLPTYYAAVAAAAMAGHVGSRVAVLDAISSSGSSSSGFATYIGGRIAKVMVINMQPAGMEEALAGGERGRALYRFRVPEGCRGDAAISRLTGPGHEATRGLSWDGQVFEAESVGKPMDTGEEEEMVMVGEDGGLRLEVPHSSAAMIRFNCG